MQGVFDMSVPCVASVFQELAGVLDVGVSLVVAAILSALIGFERERHDQPAGLRTHIVLGVGACLISIIASRVAGPDNTGRIAGQIVSGIGFLGAGAILKYGTSVRGLTTATCLWTVAGIGMAA